MSTKKPLSPFVSVKANSINQNSFRTTKLTAKSSSVSVRAERIASLYAFYQVHRPEKAKDAAGIYKSHEYEQLCARLRSQYGGLPEGWGSSSSRCGGVADGRRNIGYRNGKENSHSKESAAVIESNRPHQCEPKIRYESSKCELSREQTPAQLAMRNFRSGEQFLKSGQYNKAEAKYTTALSQKSGMMSALHSR